MLDPEQLTFVEWFWIVLAITLAVFALCCWVDMNYRFQFM